MTSNNSIPDENGEFEDWIEIYNANNYSVNVGGLYLTDSMDAPTKFRIPSHSPTSTTIGPRDYFIIFADGQKEQGIYHAVSDYGEKGEQIALIHYDEDEVLDSLSYREQFKDASFSRIEDEGPVVIHSAESG